MQSRTSKIQMDLVEQGQGQRPSGEKEAPFGQAKSSCPKGTLAGGHVMLFPRGVSLPLAFLERTGIPKALLAWEDIQKLPQEAVSSQAHGRADSCHPCTASQLGSHGGRKEANLRP